MKNLLIGPLFLALFIGSAACGLVPADKSGPAINNIKTSGNILSISDCLGTSVDISADVTDPSGVESVLLWYRTGADQKFTSTSMESQNSTYQTTLKGPDFLGKPYGTLEFYITARDKAGNTSKSAIDQSIQFLPCVGS